MYEIFGPYQLTERLNSGGMAEIFKARMFGHSGFEKTLVIKRLHPRFTQTPEFVEMLKEEAKTAVGLSHANIVQIFDLGRVQEHYYIAMEYINGRDLNQLMKRFKEQQVLISPEAALYIASEMCAGLDFAHRQRDANGRLLRLIHRDISPQNIMVSVEGDVKIVDFGIAKSLASHQETEAGIIKGKFCFMSPEQARGQKLDHRTDIFSAGIIMYELLSGRPMYENHDDHQLLEQVRNAQFVPLEHLRPDLPHAVHRVVNRALSADRDKRYPSARHLQHAIEKAMHRSGLMLSRFQLGQLLTTHFTELSARPDDVLRDFDQFDNEELSLISDYELQRTPEGDWDVPEFTDELEEIDFDDLHEEERTDPRSTLPSSLAKSSAPIPVQSPFGDAGGNFAPAAPPQEAHLFDPRYGAPQSSAAPLNHQVTLPPAAKPEVFSSGDLYSSEAPQARPQEIQVDESHRASLFEDRIDSTMILDDEQPMSNPRGNRQVPLSSNQQSAYSRNYQDAHETFHGASQRDALIDRLHQVINWAKSASRKPEGRYILAFVGLIALFFFVKMGKGLIKGDPSRRETVQVFNTDGGGMGGPKKSTSSGISAGTPVTSTQTSRQGWEEQRSTRSQQSERIVTPVTRPALPSSRRSEPAGFGESSSPDDYRREAPRGSRVTMTPSSLSIQITSEPPGAEVAIDDEWQPGTTPIIAQLKPEKLYMITLSKSGFEERRERFRPQIGEQRLSVKLTSQLGRIIIRSNPEGATVKQDGMVIGLTPLDIDNVPQEPSKFKVEISKLGYQPRAYLMNWLNADQGKLSLEVELSRLQSASEVEAKKKPKRKPRRKKRRSRPAGKGYISVRSPRWGHLFIDNRFVQDGKLIFKRQVSAGRHRVKFCFDGDRGNCAQKSISVPNGGHEKVFF